MAGRIEDTRLLTGQGRYVADRLPPGKLHAVFARSDRAGARIESVDAQAARALPGVLAVWTADDLGLPPLPPDPLPQDAGGAFARPIPLLATGRLRHVGEPVALVVAETEVAARTAADLIVIDSADDPEPPETCFVKSLGRRAETDTALAASAHRITDRINVPRVHAAPLEPRGCLGLPDGAGVHLVSSSQSPAAMVKPLAAALSLDPARVRVSAGDVGGSFGLKGLLTREEVLVAHAARRLGRPVLWTATRSESFTSDHHGRGVSGEITLGLDADLRFTAVSARFIVDAGAYPSARAMGLVNNIGGLVGVYDIPVAHAVVTGQTSPRTGIAPYRGHGRPEVTLAIEQAIDSAARRLGIDPVALRRRNLIARAALPYQGALGFHLDSGDFAGVLDHALALSAGADARRHAAQACGHLHGRALILCVEAAGGPVRQPRPDHVRLGATPDGRLRLAPGVMSTGQGHETTLTRLVSAALSVPEAAIDYVQGDSAVIPDGRGNGGSSGLAVTGPAVARATAALIDAATARAAAAFDVPPDRVVRDGDLFRLAGTNRTLSLAQIAALDGPAGLEVRESFTPPAATFPNGAHVCEVEIDPDTGVVAIAGYWAVEDVGTVLQPALVEGQMMGGIAQGISQVLGERIVHDAAGQVLTGSLMDYPLPRAADAPPLTLATHPVPTARNPLGAKGVGEAGTVGAVAATLLAIRDALGDRGADFQMPATPLAVWQALQG